jgi:hypothetical protein
MISRGNTEDERSERVEWPEPNRVTPVVDKCFTEQKGKVSGYQDGKCKGTF